LARELGDLHATKRQMKRFRDLGVLDPDLLEVIQQEIATRRRRLLGREKAPAPQVQPLLPFALSIPVAEAPRSKHEPGILSVLPMEAAPAAKPQAVAPGIQQVIKAPRSAPGAAPAASPVLVADSPPLPAAQLGALTQPRSPKALTQPRSPMQRRSPRRSLREVLASFMEQRNIFWGELLGGLLIVGCSIALVISLWTTGKLEKIPFAPFVIFAFITTSLFGAGWYTLRHWKLESTSRGLLVIASLLVPLNFLVMAGLHGRETSGWEIPLEVGAVLIFVGILPRMGCPEI